MVSAVRRTVVCIKNRCYNCRKAFKPNRTCYSLGDCQNFEPMDKPELDALVYGLCAVLPDVKVEIVSVVGGGKSIVRRDEK